MKTVTITSESQMKDLAQEFLSLVEKTPQQATVVGLQGDLGAGKTFFVKAMAKHLGVIDDVISPTFVLMRRYAVIGEGDFTSLVHIDAYRLETYNELEKIGWNSLRKERDTLLFIEWPNQIDEIQNDLSYLISIDLKENEKREVKINKEE